MGTEGEGERNRNGKWKVEVKVEWWSGGGMKRACMHDGWECGWEGYGWMWWLPQLR